jgi:hypothetical protein
LGIDETFKYGYNEHLMGQDTQLILISSDGSWKAENQAGEQFGRERMKRLPADNCTLHPDEIFQAIVREITAFRSTTPQKGRHNPGPGQHLLK